MGCYERQQDLFETVATSRSSPADSGLPEPAPSATEHLEHPLVVSSGNTCMTTGNSASGAEPAMGETADTCDGENQHSEGGSVHLTGQSFLEQVD
eukprot:s3564_g10.t1